MLQQHAKQMLCILSQTLDHQLKQLWKVPQPSKNNAISWNQVYTNPWAHEDISHSNNDVFHTQYII